MWAKSCSYNGTRGTSFGAKVNPGTGQFHLHPSATSHSWQALEAPRGWSKLLGWGGEEAVVLTHREGGWGEWLTPGAGHSLKLHIGYNESRSYSFKTGGGSKEFSTLLVGFHQSLSKNLRESNVCLHSLQPSQGNLAQLRYHRLEVFQKILLPSSPLPSLKSIKVIHRAL